MSTLHVHRTGMPARYEIADGDTPVTTVTAHIAQHGGELDLAGHTYQLDGSTFGGTSTLRTPDGRTVATAERTGVRHRRITTGAGEYRLSRTGLGTRTLHLIEGNTRVGQIHRISRGAEATLPDLEIPVQVFIVITALAIWQRRRRAAVMAR